MKIIFTLLSVLLTIFSSFAQPDETYKRVNNYQGKLTVSTTTFETVRVLIDGNDYNSKGNDNEFVINDIRPGYHTVKVFRKKKSRNNYDGKFNRNLQMIYSGNIYVKPQCHVDIVINRFGKAFTDERRMDAGYYDENVENDDHGGWGNNNDNYMQPMNSRTFDQFKQVLRNESFDNTRLVVAKQTIATNYFSSAQVKEIVLLFSFENSKLEIAKYCYQYTVDKNNYFILNDAFSYSSSKEELARFMLANR